MGHAKEKAGVLVAAALGVVFGDIGTSPLYTLKVCFIGQSSITPSPQNVLGLVSLIFWSLMLVVSSSTRCLSFRPRITERAAFLPCWPFSTRKGAPDWAGD